MKNRNKKPETNYGKIGQALMEYEEASKAGYLFRSDLRFIRDEVTAKRNWFIDKYHKLEKMEPSPEKEAIIKSLKACAGNMQGTIHELVFLQDYIPDDIDE